MVNFSLAVCFGSTQEIESHLFCSRLFSSSSPPLLCLPRSSCCLPKLSCRTAAAAASSFCCSSDICKYEEGINWIIVRENGKRENGLRLSLFSFSFLTALYFFGVIIALSFYLRRYDERSSDY